jgi:DNA-binding NarL/FixJ family response regulator
MYFCHQSNQEEEMAEMHKIIIVDDHLLFRESIKLLIEKEGIGQVIAEAEHGLEFLEQLKTKKPDLVIMDIDMPYMNGIDATKNALKLYPEMKILLLSMMSEYVNYTEIMQSGAIGHVLKSSGKRDFETAIKNAIRHTVKLIDHNSL